MASIRICSVEGCCNPVIGRGYCERHYRRFRRHGHPEGGGTARGEPRRWIEANVQHDGDECLLWPFARMGGGYGHLVHEGRFIPAHRLMCSSAHGQPADETYEAAHSCGNAACVNPRHLRWATPLENNADKVEHGTQLHGEAIHNTFLTVREVEAIRHLAASGVVQRRIAEAFNITPQRVNEIVKGKTWKHAPGPVG